jgi:hypothetical protein
VCMTHTAFNCLLRTYNLNRHALRSSGISLEFNSNRISKVGYKLA